MNAAAVCRFATHRVLFSLAGVMTLVSAVLALTVSPWFLALTVAVAVNELAFAASGACPASLLLGRLCRPAGRTS